MTSHQGRSTTTNTEKSGSKSDASALSAMLSRLKSGDESAANEILDRYESQVRLVVRRFLPRVLRSRFDSQDIMQSVWRSFFQRVRAEEGAAASPEEPSLPEPSREFQDSSQLFAFLSRMARNKVIDQYRRETSQKADVHRLRTIHSEVGTELDPPSQEESPSAMAEAADELSHWRSLVPEERQELIDMKADGHSSKEIGDKLGISERTVQRVLEDLRQRVERRRAGHHESSATI